MPRGSMLKYFQDTGGDQTEHKAPLHWPGTVDGYPLRGNTPPDLKQAEYENIPLAMDFRSDTFDLDDAASRAKFNAIMDRVVNGWYMQHRRDDFVDKETGHRMVGLEWVQISGETPQGKIPGAQDHAKTVTVKDAPPATPLRSIGRPKPEPPSQWPRLD